MSKTITFQRRWLTLVVLAHLFVSMAHGSAHTGAEVPLSAAAMLFVYVVVLAGPLIGLALTWPAPRAGGWVIAGAMAASLAFGLVNHFVLPSPDHVTQVVQEWRPLFAGSAVMLAITEGFGSALAIGLARDRGGVS